MQASGPKWLFRGIAAMTGGALLCLTRLVFPTRNLFTASPAVLAGWYPHAGRVLYYCLKTFLPLQVLLLVAATVCLLYFFIPAIYIKLKNRRPMRPASRLLLLRLAAFIVVSLPMAILVYFFLHMMNKTDKANREFNDKINERNKAYAMRNSFGFTDREHTKEKPKGVYRIAVLGDSFIWGDGLPYEKVWSHLLEKKLLAEYDSVEVLHRGLCGWSTLDEFNFFKQHGADFQINLLIIGWVDNDPDNGTIPQVHPREAKSEFPLLSKICPPFAQKLVISKENESYDQWLVELYSPQNLRDYQLVLDDFNNYLNTHGVVSLVVMTPGQFSPEMKLRFDKVEPLIGRVGFTCLNLCQPTQNALANYPQEMLQANPVNGHPGVLMTEEFSDEVKDYLEQNGYLSSLPKKKPAGASAGR